MATDFTSLTKVLYDLHKSQEPADYEGSPLAQLVVDNFDEEQIWQELELQNDDVLKHFKNAIDEALSDNKLTLLSAEEEEEEQYGEEEEATDDENNVEEQEEEPPRLSKKKALEADDGHSEDDSDIDFDVDALEKREKQKKARGRTGSKAKEVPSEVDDTFFKLSEMETFLDDMDKQEEKNDEHEDGVNYFQDLPSDVDDDDVDLDQILSSKKKKKNTVCIISQLSASYFGS